MSKISKEKFLEKKPNLICDIYEYDISIAREKRFGPISSTDEIRIIDQEKFCMSKSISIVISIYHRDLCILEGIVYFIVDGGCSIDTSFQDNTYINISFFGLDNRIEQRTVRPGIYLDPDTMFGMLNRGDEFFLYIQIG